MSSDESEISFNDSDSGSDLFGGSAFDKDWDDLEEEEKGAALLLGYDGSRWPAIQKDWPDWDELGEESREAAQILGMDEDSWPPRQDLFTLPWADLGCEQQAAAAQLGYTAESWPTASREWSDWDDLSPADQAAASTLGLDEYKWPPEADDWDAEDLFASAEIDEEEGDSDKENVILLYKRVIEKEKTVDGPDEWGFRALSRIVCLQCELRNFDQMIAAYKTMIGDEYRRVTTRLKQEEIERVLGVAGTVSSGEGDEVLLQVFETTLSMFETQPRIWVQTQLKLAEVFKRKGVWDRVRDACEAIHARTQKYAASAELLKKDLPAEGGWGQLIKRSSSGYTCDDPMFATELTHTFALEIERELAIQGGATRKKFSGDHLRDLYRRAKACDEASTANPECSGVILDCGGELSMAVRDFSTAYTLFVEAFTRYESAGNASKIECIKKCVVSKMLSADAINPFENPAMSGYRSHESVAVWYQMLLAYQQKPAPSVEDFTSAIQELSQDPLVTDYIVELKRNAHTRKLQELIQPYATVRLEYIGDMLGLATDDVEQLCSLLILDETLHGWLDQVDGVLHVEGVSDAGLEARRFAGVSEWVSKLESIRRNLLVKVANE